MSKYTKWNIKYKNIVLDKLHNIIIIKSVFDLMNHII